VVNQLPDGKPKDALARALTIRFLSIAFLCYIFINLAFVLAFNPLYPNAWWGPLAITGAETDFLRWTIFTLRFYLLLFPFLVTANTGLWWFMQVLHSDPPPKLRLLWGNLVGILIALPLLMQLPLFMANLGFDPEFAPLEVRALSLPIFFWTVLIYLGLVFTITASHPLADLKQLILNPYFWLISLLLCFPAYLSFIGLILADQYLIPLAAIPLALLTPSLLFSFSVPTYLRYQFLMK